MSPIATDTPANHPFPVLTFAEAFDRAFVRYDLDAELASGRPRMRQLTAFGPLPAHAKAPMAWILGDGQPVLDALAETTGHPTSAFWRQDDAGCVFAVPEVAEAYWLYANPTELLEAIRYSWAAQAASERLEVEQMSGRPYEEVVEGPEPSGM